MAVTPGAAGHGTIDAGAGQDILNGTKCTTLRITCLSTSPNALEVNIPVLHGTEVSDWTLIEVGQTLLFRFGGRWSRELYTCNCRGIGGTAANISWDRAVDLRDPRISSDE